ncbi:MAG TPA: vWA domain-containing protein, partial [Gemmataceae bacterium]|nr:vWA domain-containing protein [Gemmataceae bacterium]
KIESKAMKLEGELDKRKLDLVQSTKRYEDLLALKLLLEQNLGAAKLDLAKSDQALTLTKSDLAKMEAALASTKLANQGLTNQTTVLSSQIDRLRAAADNRFAGIEMGGSRVLFLVDMSGSMRMKDYYIEDPDKWPLVCAILGKLIQSIPDLKYFQVILFSDKIRYPLANAGKWHEYQGPETIKNVVDAVRSEVPENETNMSAVFEEAFKYRALGLDTIYLLSDGLPNAGDGLPKGAEKLSETERSTILGKYIRDKMKATWNVPYGRWTQQRVRINAVGFYFDSPDVGAFLWALARDNDGGFVGLSKP